MISANRRSGRLVHFFFSGVIRLYMAGKQLLKSGLSFPYDEKYVQVVESIVKTKKGYRCVRCDNEDQQLFASFPCARCGRICTYCRKCVTMGRCSECNPLVIWTGPIPSTSFSSPLKWSGKLSPAQQLASDEVCHAIDRNDSLLVWAVCGAGKTEVLFAGIDLALSHGKRVCIAAPRTDVVLELAPRLASVFPSVDMAALYGGSQDRGKLASLTVATTHQLLRYYRAFDVMIVDEVDAFPYSVDPMLSYAVERARKPTSSLIYLTATPNEQWQHEVKSGKRKAVMIQPVIIVIRSLSLHSNGAAIGKKSGATTVYRYVSFNGSMHVYHKRSKPFYSSLTSNFYNKWSRTYNNFILSLKGCMLKIRNEKKKCSLFVADTFLFSSQRRF
ncbi:Type III restriction enzyme, res subunit [Anoxybacillus sp. BCO1]|nr:Type III restriction enzyme, res subunit [Anoxybacillus sp. BCO1]